MRIFKVIKFRLYLEVYKKLLESALECKNEAEPKSDEWKKWVEYSARYAIKMEEIQRKRNKILDSLKTQY